jgi:hypothetical protein
VIAHPPLPAFPACGPVALVERMRLSRTAINPLTYLATDFLNQFNEVAMSLDMLEDWPDMFDDLRGWQPRGYAEHFQRSGFSDSATIIEAYHAAPRVIRQGFDEEVAELCQLTMIGLRALENAMLGGLSTGLLAAANALSADIRAHVALLAGMINAGQASPAPSTDRESAAASDSSGMNQADIDSLFA